MKWIFSIALIALLGCSNDDPTFDDTPTPTPTPNDQGNPYRVEQHKMSNNLVIDIYTPVDFPENTSLPIIYFNDGDNFASVFGAMTSKVDEPFIMVGLHAGSKRNDRYIPYVDQWIYDNWGYYTSETDIYSKQIVEEVVPFVESQFNIDESRRGIFGISLGGLHAGWIALKYPEVFNFSAAISPSFWVADYKILSESTGGQLGRNRFYFDMGTAEWNYYIPYITLLKGNRLRYGKEIFYYEIPGGGHDTGSWIRRIDVPLKIFLGQLDGAELLSFDVQIECIPSQSVPGRVFRRINPIFTFSNGIKYSLNTECTYEILEGEGTVTEDGRFEVDSNQMKVSVSYLDQSEVVTLTNCQ